MHLSTLDKLYFGYNPAKDPTGDKGRGIAEAVFKNCGYDTVKLNRWIMTHSIQYIIAKEEQRQKNRRKDSKLTSFSLQ
jgi:hypothetical protein